MNDIIKHLEFIQAIINRMNSNSFQLKGWAITIVSALLALYASSSNITYIFIAIVPTMIFWFLDSYYLQLERKFRKLYMDVVAGNRTDFQMSISNYTGGKCHFFNVFCFSTITLLYGTILLGLVIGGLLLKYYDRTILIYCH